MPALLGTYQRKPVRIWWRGVSESSYYVLPGYVDEDYIEGDGPIADPILLFTGNIEAISAIDDFITIGVARSIARLYPTMRIVPPFANHILRAGSRFTIDNVTYTVAYRNG